MPTKHANRGGRAIGLPVLFCLLALSIAGPARGQVSARYVTFVSHGGHSQGATTGIRASVGQTVAGRAGRLHAGFGAIAARFRGSGTSIEEEDASTPRSFELHQNYPNPFNPVTTVTLDLAQSGPVRLEIFDSLGRLRRVALDRTLEAGRHSVTIDAGDLESGVYVYRIRSAATTASRRMVLLK